MSYPKLIDLTMTYQEGMRGVSFETARTLEKDGWNAKTLHLYSHAGTHMDAPAHFGVNDLTIDKTLLEKCVGRTWIARLKEIKPKALMGIEDLGDTAHRLQPGDSLVLHTGWSRHHGSDLYRNALPRVSERLAHWCCEQKINMLGVEPPSVADVNNLEEVTRIHRILLKGGVTIIEGLCNLEGITGDKCWLIALPLKIFQGDGAPARVIAIESEDLSALQF